jgi:hypothetical protein
MIEGLGRIWRILAAQLLMTDLSLVLDEVIAMSRKENGFYLATAGTKSCFFDLRLLHKMITYARLYLIPADHKIWQFFWLSASFLEFFDGRVSYHLHGEALLFARAWMDVAGVIVVYSATMCNLFEEEGSSSCGCHDDWALAPLLGLCIRKRVKYINIFVG